MSLLDVELESVVYSLDADTKLMCRKSLKMEQLCKPAAENE
jgi:hypothetical protein